MALETLKTQFLVKNRQRAGPGVCLSFITGCQETSPTTVAVTHNVTLARRKQSSQVLMP